VKKLVSILIGSALLLNAAPVQAQTGDGAVACTRDATVLSMMGWGVGLAVGVALLCGLIEQETSHSHND
jgi:hypothetical protein